MPSTGAETSLIRFEFMSRWSPNCRSPVRALTSPFTEIPAADESCREPVPVVSTFRFWFTSVVMLIVPALSSITFLPLT